MSVLTFKPLQFHVALILEWCASHATFEVRDSTRSCCSPAYSRSAPSCLREGNPPPQFWGCRSERLEQHPRLRTPLVMVLLPFVSAGTAEVQREREGHRGVDVGTFSHARQDAALREQPERRDQDQAGPLLCVRRCEKAARDRPR